jgi:hypothetical protein
VCFVFRGDEFLSRMLAIIVQVKSSVAKWQKAATAVGISMSEQLLMSGVFRFKYPVSYFY